MQALISTILDIVCKQGLSGDMAQEGKALEEKLGMLKDQLSDLRTSIKVGSSTFA